MAEQKRNGSIYAHKIEIYPSKAMKEYFDKCCGYMRFMWNTLLGMWKQSREDGSPMTLGDCGKLHNKQQFEWEREVPGYIRSEAQSRLQDTMNSYYDKSRKVHTGFPKFKSKKTAKKSFCVYAQKFGKDFLIKRGKTWYFRIGGAENMKIKKDKRYVRLAEKPRFEPSCDKIIQIIISRDVDKYYASFVIELGEPMGQTSGDEWVGIDPGVKNLVNLSTGEKMIIDKKKIADLEKKIHHYQRKMSKSLLVNKGKPVSNTYLKTKTKFEKVWQKVRFVRKDFIEKISTTLLRKYKYVAIEVNDVSNLQQLNKNAKSLTDACITKFRERLKQKAATRGCFVYEVPAQKASTQTCSKCGYRRQGENKLGRSEDTYVCPVCGHTEDRDINAAKNILFFGRQIAVGVSAVAV